MALVDSDAAFTEHCTSVGAPASVIRALRRANITTFAGLAFACGTPQNLLQMRPSVSLQTHCVLRSLPLNWHHLGGYNLRLQLSW